MAITYPLTLPSTSGPVAARIGLNDVAGASVSPWTGAQQIHQHQGAWLTADIQLAPMTRDEWAPWAAFFAALRGPVGTFWLPAYLSETPRGTGGTVIVDGADQTGSTLAVAGFTPSATGVLLAGDALQVGNELKIVLADVDADGSGDASIDIYPPLRTSPADGASVTLTNPMGRFRLREAVRGWDLRPGRIFGGMTIAAIEDIST